MIWAENKKNVARQWAHILYPRGVVVIIDGAEYFFQKGKEVELSFAQMGDWLTLSYPDLAAEFRRWAG